MAKQKSASVPTAAKPKVEAPAAKRKRVSPLEFIQQVRAEASKVTWTTWGETWVSTVMVLIMVAFAALFFFLVDQGLSLLVRSLLNLG